MARARSFLDERRERLAASDAPVNGIAALEVDAEDQTRLTVLFVKPLPGEPGGAPPGEPLGRERVSITGGDRVRGISVREVSSSANALSVRVSEPGDHSTYALTVEGPGFDPILRSIRFGFKAHCPTDFDCAEPPPPAADPRREPRPDYLARDYESYRRLILDRMAALAPDWTDRNAADTGVALVELLAWLGDRLSYRLDLADTEAYLETARLRASAARHARLVGYEMHHGVSARAFVQVRLAEGVDTLELRRDEIAFATRTDALSAPRGPARDAARAFAQGATIFEPAHDARLVRANERLRFHDWGDPDAVLARGATEAWLRDPGAAAELREGDLLVLVQRRDPATGREADADPRHRQAVRLVTDPETLEDPLEPEVPGEDGPLPLRILRVRWAAEDALGFDLAIGGAETGPPGAEALGSIVLADHGFTLPGREELGTARSLVDPELPPAEGMADEPKTLAELDRPRAFAPRLSRNDLTFAEPFDPGARASAAGLARPDPARAKPAITLLSAEAEEIDPATARLWTPERTLLGAAAGSRRFVTEVEADGSARLRFGDGVRGRRPEDGERFEATYRVGAGPAGNVGAGALVHAAADRTGIASVENPLPAAGGARRESVAEVRQRAPVSFRELRRAVTLEDYETLLNRREDVQRAQARKRWLGSWPAIFLTVDRVGGGEVDEAWKAELLAYLEPFRMMGHDLSVDAPIRVPLEIELKVCVGPEHFAEDVREAVADAFSPGLTREGTRGFFHPDEITFGAQVFLSRIYERALAVEGVAEVRATRFRRAGGAAGGLETGVLEFGRREIPILSNDPNRPDAGALTIQTEGGR
ncbi:MAG: putative baseplate assembly protein [Pseudomonadota bacterium]